ncbi:MAG TPA: LamG domain-containing protein, partial [Polyangia bacterium]|nr:LamG domain-containing protein [Polyangia bacterium]
MKRVSYIVVAPILTMAALSTAHATARVWQGGDGVFGTAGNWNPSGSPGSGDDLAFSGSTTACNINSSVTVNSINISVGVTVTQAAGVTLSINGSFTQSAGTFVGGNSTMDLGGDFNLSGGAFTATSGRMEVGGAFNKTSGSFTHHSGQVMLNATSSKTFATNGLTFNNLTLNDGVAGYWKLDDGTTPIVDSSGYTHSGTLTNTPTWAGAGNGGGVNFTDGNAMILNGTNQYATITRTTTLEPTSVSVSVWIKRNGTQSQYAKVVNKTYNNSASAPFQSYSVQLNNSNTDSGQIAWETGHTGPTNSTLFSTANAVQDGIWTHVVAVYDPAGSNPRKRLYVNGTLNASVDLGTALLYDTNGTGNLFFGQGGGGTQYFKGTIDDVRIYRRALSSAEVADLFSGAGRITSVATQTLNAALITAGDLNIVSGTLDVSAAGCASSLPCGVTVGGSYNNFGGLFTPRTGTLTFNGSASTNVLLTERLNFNNVTFSGTGTWTLQDRLFVDNTLAMSAASTLSQSSNNYTIHAGTLNKTAGTISGSGSVVLDSSSNQTLVVNSLGPSLRIEVPQESGLVGYWKLDEARYTTASDSSGSGYNGTLTNYATWSTNVPTSPAIPIDDAGSVSLDGTSQYVSLGNPANLNFAGQITMAAWVNMTASSGTQNILAHGYDASTEVYMRISGGQYQLGSWLSPTSYQTTYAVPGGDVGAWVHVVGVYDGTTWRLYRNGTEVSTFVTANGSKTVGANWAIGARGDGTSRWFGGNIDDVRIYNRGLSANEVSALYTSGYTSGSTIVYSLGGTSAVTGTLKLDSGSLDAVSYQNSITGA